MGANVWPFAARAATARTVIGTWGFDLSAMDGSVKPGDDFFRFTGGTWMKNTQIPADRSRWGSFNILGAKSEDDVRDAIETAAKGPLPAGSVARKAVDYFRSFNDVAAIEAKGLEPVKADLARIAAVQTHEDIVQLAAERDFRANLPIGVGVGLDAKRPDIYVVSVAQSGLGMPDRKVLSVIRIPIDSVLFAESIRPTGVGKSTDFAVWRNTRRFYGCYGI